MSPFNHLTFTRHSFIHKYLTLLAKPEVTSLIEKQWFSLPGFSNFM